MRAAKRHIPLALRVSQSSKCITIKREAAGAYYSGDNIVNVDYGDRLIQPLRFSRNMHPKSFQTISCRTNCRQESFLPRTIRDWNALPSTTVSAESLDEFKTLLANSAQIRWLILWKTKQKTTKLLRTPDTAWSSTWWWWPLTGRSRRTPYLSNDISLSLFSLSLCLSLSLPILTVPWKINEWLDEWKKERTSVGFDWCITTVSIDSLM